MGRNKLPHAGHTRVIAAFTNSQGEPDYAIVDVKCTTAELNDGDHYEKAREQLEEDGYEEPIVLFDESDCLRYSWLVEGAKAHLGVK